MRSKIITLQLWICCFWQGLREWCGDAAYERYLHSTANSGCKPVLSPAEFYVEQTNRRYSRPNRCC
ncbi:MAG: hypothetical protein PVS2B2_05380 [Candidatus Acidiferrum sp.]